LPAEGIVARHDAVPLLRKPLAAADLTGALRGMMAARTTPVVAAVASEAAPEMAAAAAAAERPKEEAPAA
jgi:hypothetical protein